MYNKKSLVVKIQSGHIFVKLRSKGQAYKYQYFNHKDKKEKFSDICSLECYKNDSITSICCKGCQNDKFDYLNEELPLQNGVNLEPSEFFPFVT